ncbi:ribosomal L1 domain-containing protein CG13096-like [Anopheles maculipalpis]|uniref:ribosomal L1 domain-containing protein CG13096-like n=1 Tax=Anopheles maculipalpis TaxID=1496333 RepID=UPI0021594EC0|nr:ribosomal L1 domain-containing protein CG13096-like [Anopheles maculipalpis]
MKVKVAKTLKPVEKSQALLKKSKSGIQKTKKLKPALKPSTAKVAVASGMKAAPGEEKLPAKPAFSLLLKPKKQAQQKKSTTGKQQNKQENAPSPTKQKNGTGTANKQKNAKSVPVVKQANGAEPAKKQQNAKAKPDVKKADVSLVKKENGAAPSGKKQKQPAKGKPAIVQKKEKKADDQKPSTEASEANKLKKRLVSQVKALKWAERKVEGGVPETADEATLALVPEELISKESFRKAFEIIRSKVDDKEKKLFGDELKYSLQIVSVKVPRCPQRNSRISLPHPLLRAEDDVCLIVKDLVRGREVDFTPTLHHWEDKLKELNLDHKLHIIPFQQLKRDYGSYEMKRKLAHRFERFLVDGRISGHVFSFLGAQFAKRCKNPTPVSLIKESKIKEAIEQALSVQTYRQGNTGRMVEIKFAAHWMPLEDAVENGMALLEKLKTDLPGGWLNIHAINVTTATEKTRSFPIYVSTIDPNLVPVPMVVGPREKFVKKQQALIEKRSGGEYEVTKDGIIRKKRKLNLDGEPINAEESDVEVEELEPEEDDNWVPYDDDLPIRRRTGGPKRQKGPKMRVK